MRNKEKKEINITVGENLRFYREESGYSRERLAELVGVTPRFLADAEVGVVGISLTNLRKICDILGISSDRLLWRQTPQPPPIAERLSHIDPKYMGLVEGLILRQLELIALAGQEKRPGKTRR